MDAQRIFALLKVLGANHYDAKKTDEWVSTKCPLAPWTHRSGTSSGTNSGITVKKDGYSHFNCFTCGHPGSLMELVNTIEDYDKLFKKSGYDLKTARAIVLREDEKVVYEVSDSQWSDPTYNRKPVTVWAEKFLNKHKPIHHYPQAVNYIYDRQINPRVVKKLDLRFDKEKQRIVFPIRDWFGNLIGMNGRDITNRSKQNPKYPKYYMYKYKDIFNNLPWYGEQWVDIYKPVLIVESVFDLASALRVYDNVMCSMSSGIGKAKLERINQLIEIYTFYDYGTGGDTARASFNKYLKNPIIQHLVPTKEQDDVGNMSKLEIESALKPYLSI